MNSKDQLPRWVDLGFLPLFNLALALLAAGIVVKAIGQNPSEVILVMAQGAFGSARGLSYTLYYATSFTFTGLAVAIAFHGGLFNIGGEGQAIMGGLGVGLTALALSDTLPSWLMLPCLILVSLLFGAIWAVIPGWLQAYRGSHVVITTIMFNFIATTILIYLIVNWLKVPGLMALESEPFAPSARLPRVHEMFQQLNIDWPSSPLNFSIFLALLASAFVWLFLWRTRYGYRLRAVGLNDVAAKYAGVDSKRYTLIAMSISGALAGLVGMNEISGVSGRLILDFVAGAGFTGIAVALMGRNHPAGILLTSVLFGGLFQGGAEVAFEVNGFTRDMVITLQGMIVLFSGAMAYVASPWLNFLLSRIPTIRKATPDG